jgi:hypothetical protein
MGVFKQREMTGFNGFSSEPPTIPVTTQLSVPRTRQNGKFGRFNRLTPGPRTTMTGRWGGH